MKHRFCAAALAAVLLLSAAPLSPAASAAFSDAEGTWAAEVIEKAEGYGLMNGYPDGTFGVGKELTRGEFVAVLCRMFGWDAASPGAPSFSDCPASHWAYSYVETALAHGVMDAGGAFRPEDYISREEMAVMLVRALGYGTLAQSLSGLELPFDDVTGVHRHRLRHRHDHRRGRGGRPAQVPAPRLRHPGGGRRHAGAGVRAVHLQAGLAPRLLRLLLLFPD